MILDAPWYVPNTVIRRDLQIPTVKEEIRRYSSQYSARLSAHPNGLVVNLMELPNNGRLRRHLPNDLPKIERALEYIPSPLWAERFFVPTWVYEYFLLKARIDRVCFKTRHLYSVQLIRIMDRLCGLVVRVLGYRSGGPGSIPGTTRKKK
jgi:hypothetical protein